jgi:hypothetical protein
MVSCYCFGFPANPRTEGGRAVDGQIAPISCRQFLAPTSTEQTAAAAAAGEEEDGGTAASLCGGLWHGVRGKGGDGLGWGN